jgi:putative DNA primase/helicase
LFRSIDLWKPTLLIDEVDACLKDNEELRGLINSGHTRDSAYTIRCVGDDHIPTPFNTWAAKALSGIGHVADTLMDRSIILELRRKLPTESVERIRYAGADLFSELSAKLARFAEDNAEAVRLARPTLPHTLNDRQQDNWEPLLAIAMVAGGDWYKTATAAALKISSKEEESKTVGTELLSDIQEIFETKNLDRVGSGELILYLIADDEKPWATYNRGFQIKPRQIASRLKGYGIHSKTIRIGAGTIKGYEKDQFTEAFNRYVPVSPSVKVTTSQPASILDLSPVCKSNTAIPVTFENPCKTAPIQTCDVVTDRIPPQRINSIFMAGL